MLTNSAARVACARWDLQYNDYIRFVHAEIDAVGDIQDVAAGRVVLKLFEEKWERVSDVYARLEIDCPEPENPPDPAAEVIVVHTSRQGQWGSATEIYDRGRKAIANRIIVIQAALETQGRLLGSRRA